MSHTWNLPEDRYFDPDPAVKRAALGLYQRVRDLPIVSPHGHVDPRLFSDPAAGFGSPADLLIILSIPVFRMLHSQGAGLEELGLARLDGGATEKDHRVIWRRFCSQFHLFRGTPSGIAWLEERCREAKHVEVPDAANAERLYDQVAERLASPEFRPRAVFERFNIEVLATTDAAGDTLEAHAAIRASGWGGRVIPTFRPDAAVTLDSDTWRASLATLETASGRRIETCAGLLEALGERRAFFKQMGATATDHGVFQPAAEPLEPAEAERIFAGALAALGHTFSPFVSFHGGKGVATTGGAFLVLEPTAVLVTLVVFAVVLAATHIVSLASIVAACVLPVAVVFFEWASAATSKTIIAFTFIVCAWVVWRHRANLARLRAGTEPKLRHHKGDHAPPAPPAG